jgi:hypothetical protein
MPDGSEIETDAPAEDPLPWLALRVRELPNGEKVAEVMHNDFALGVLPLTGWKLEGSPERFGVLTVGVQVETADIYGGTFKSVPAGRRAQRERGVDPDAR